MSVSFPLAFEPESMHSIGRTFKESQKKSRNGTRVGIGIP
jgi:hypothetical protein